MQSSSYTAFLIPGAIVAGAALIAVAIYFGLSASGPSAATAAQGSAGGGTPSAADQQGSGQQNDQNTDAVNPVTEDDFVRGDPEAPVKIVEYSDFACPFCKRLHETMQVVMEEYGPAGTGDVAWVYRQFPVPQLHPQNAQRVALASECVAAAGGDEAFWQFADEWFAVTETNDQTDLDTVLPQLYETVGVDPAAMATCVEEERYADRVDEDRQNAAATGGRGTPWSVVIGPNGQTFPLNGAQPQRAIEQLIDVALQEQAS